MLSLYYRKPHFFNIGSHHITRKFITDIEETMRHPDACKTSVCPVVKVKNWRCGNAKFRFGPWQWSCAFP